MPVVTIKHTVSYEICARWFNWLWLSDAIWRQRSGPKSVQVMACCLAAPSHYLNQCQLTTQGVYGIHMIAQEVPMNLIRNMCSEITFWKLQPHLTGVMQWVLTPKMSRYITRPHRLFWLMQSNQPKHVLDSLRPSGAFMFSKQTIIGWNNGLSPGRHQAIICPGEQTSLKS